MTNYSSQKCHLAILKFSSIRNKEKSKIVFVRVTGSVHQVRQGWPSVLRAGRSEDVTWWPQCSYCNPAWAQLSKALGHQEQGLGQGPRPLNKRCCQQNARWTWSCSQSHVHLWVCIPCRINNSRHRDIFDRLQCKNQKPWAQTTLVPWHWFSMQQKWLLVPEQVKSSVNTPWFCTRAQNCDCLNPLEPLHVSCCLCPWACIFN